MWVEAFTAKTISSGSSETTKHIHLFDRLNIHMLEYAITGEGKVSIEAFTSVSGEYWISSGVVLRRGTKLSGPSGDGKDLINLFLKPGEFVRFVVSAIDAEITLTLWFSQK